MTDGIDGGAAGAGAGGGSGAAAGGASAMDFLGGGASGAAAADGGAGAAGGAGEGGAQEMQGGADPDWYGSLSADLTEGETASNRDWIKAKGFKDLDGVAKALRSAERTIHDSGRIKIPGEGATETEIAEFRKGIGVPDDATGYAMPVLKDQDGKPVEMDTAKLTNIAAIAHRNGIPKAAFEATMQAIAEADAGDFAAQEAELSKLADAHVKTWGADKDNKLAAINSAIGALGLKRDEVLSLRAALGPARALDVMARIGAGVTEDTLLHGGGERGFLGDPVAAQRELDAIKADPVARGKVFVPGTPENARYARLQDIVGAAEERKRLQQA